MTQKYYSEDDGDSAHGSRVLKIKVGSFDEFREESVESLKESVEEGEPQPAELVFESPDEALNLFSGSRYRILKTIEQEEPNSISELARATSEDKGNVSKVLQDFEEYGIVDLEWHGQKKKPTLNYDEIQVEIGLDFD